jgi:hypothetical protein
METQPAYTLKDLLTEIVGGVAKAVSNRDGEPRPLHEARIRASTYMVMAFSPRDAIEAMLAGQCCRWRSESAQIWRRPKSWHRICR